MRQLRYPFPELFSDKPWKIFQAENMEAFVAQDPTEGKMVVPLGNSPAERFIRCHELFHVAYSPEELPSDINHYVFNCVEDARVNMSLVRNMGLKGELTSRAMNSRVWANAHKAQKKGDLHHALFLIATSGFDIFDELYPKATTSVQRVVTKTQNALWQDVPPGKIPPLERVYELCRTLQKAQKAAQQSQPSAPDDPLAVFDTPKPSSAQSEPMDFGEAMTKLMEKIEQAELNRDAQAAEQDKPEKGEQSEAVAPERPTFTVIDEIFKDEQRPVEPPKPPKPVEYGVEHDLDAVEPGAVPEVLGLVEETNKAKGHHPDTVKDPEAMWDKMIIKRPRLSKPSVDPKLGRKKRHSSDEGVVPTAMHRYYTDGAIFSNLKRGRSMSIVCDTSSSMGLSMDEIVDFLRVAPASTLAMYNSQATIGIYTGQLVVLAAKGRRVSEADLRRCRQGGTNSVDGRALRWLARQSGPRVWISDGFVNSHSSRNWEKNNARAAGSFALDRDCLDICLEHNIRQFPDFETFLACLHADKLDQWRFRVGHMSLKHYKQAMCPERRIAEAVWQHEHRSHGSELPFISRYLGDKYE